MEGLLYPELPDLLLGLREKSTSSFSSDLGETTSEAPCSTIPGAALTRSAPSSADTLGCTCHPSRQKQAYTLSDRGTWLATHNLDLELLVEVARTC